MTHDISKLFRGGNELSDWAGAHKILAALVIYLLIGIVFWIWFWSSGQKAPKDDDRIRRFFEVFYAPASLPAAWAYSLYRAVRGEPAPHFVW